ncbi:hypothetical protein M0P65_05850 [Candidatus Gracilibacteria bacterium]|jgi:hypothetical protein|nr:hypothetical protein [Candidatus Gracilibacteria bacterium]
MTTKLKKIFVRIFAKIHYEKKDVKVSVKKTEKKVVEEVKLQPKVRKRNEVQLQYERMTDVLKCIKDKVTEILKENNISYKKAYYYSGIEKKYIKFYNIQNTGGKTLSDILEIFQKLPNIVANEVKINENNEVSIYVYNQLGDKKAPFVSEEIPKIEKPKNKEIEITTKYYFTGVAEGKSEQELIDLLIKEDMSTIHNSLIEDYMPDAVIQKMFDEDKRYYPIVINIAGEQRIKWKTTNE